MRVLVFISLSVLIAFYSCSKCKDLDFCPLPETAEEYFSVYKSGAYWIYYNDDSTLYDSVFVSNYNQRKDKEDGNDCIEWTDATFLLHSEYLSRDTIEGFYGNNGRCDNSNLTLDLESGPLSIYSDVGRDTLYTNTPSTKHKTLTQLTLNNLTYQKVYFQALLTPLFDDNVDIWLAPDIGIVKYTSYNLDTFYLSKYYIP